MLHMYQMRSVVDCGVIDRAEYYSRICLHCTSTVSLIKLGTVVLDAI